MTRVAARRLVNITVNHGTVVVALGPDPVPLPETVRDRHPLPQGSADRPKLRGDATCSRKATGIAHDRLPAHQAPQRPAPASVVAKPRATPSGRRRRGGHHRRSLVALRRHSDQLGCGEPVKRRVFAITRRGEYASSPVVPKESPKLRRGQSETGEPIRLLSLPRGEDLTEAGLNMSRPRIN